MEQRTSVDKIWRFLRRYNRYIKVGFISLIALVIAMLPTEMFGVPGLNPIQQRVIAIFVWAACMWIVEAVPAWTTSLLIIVIMLLTVSDSAITPLISGHFMEIIRSVNLVETADDVNALFGTWPFRNAALIDTINDSIINIALLIGIFLRIRTLKH